MINESIARTRLIADLMEAGIDPDKYFGPQRIEPSSDGFSSTAYAQQLADLYASYKGRFEDLQKAFENSRQDLIEWHKAAINAF